MSSEEYQKSSNSNTDHHENPYVNSLMMMRSDDKHHHEHDHGDEHDYYQHSMMATAAASSGKVAIGNSEGVDHRQIPYFVEESIDGDGVAGRREEERMEELDLELRLGPERQDTVTTTTLSTREFF